MFSVPIYECSARTNNRCAVRRFVWSLDMMLMYERLSRLPSVFIFVFLRKNDIISIFDANLTAFLPIACRSHFQTKETRALLGI